MSYESYRNEMILNLSLSFPEDEIQRFLSVMDSVSSKYAFSLQTTDIIVADGIPDAVLMYVAAKSVENLKKGTLENYSSTLKLFFSVIRKQTEDVTPTDIRNFLNWYKMNNQIKNNTLEHKRIILNGFFNWCVDEDYCRKNPCRRIKPIKCGDSERLPMTAVELELVRNSCKTLREKAMVDFLYSTACRVGEFCALKRSNVNFVDRTVRIEHGKGDKARTTFLNAEAVISLKAYLESRADDCEALFTQVKGERSFLSRKAVQEEINRIVSRCNLSVHVTPHIFRHTAASIALQRGMPIEKVQKFLGHARIQTTLRYAKVLNFDVQLAHQMFVA